MQSQNIHVPTYGPESIETRLARCEAALGIGEKEMHIIFDGPPAHESGRFVEVEDGDGHSIRVGEWVERPDGLWALVIRQSAQNAEVVEAARELAGMVGRYESKRLAFQATRRPYLELDLALWKAVLAAARKLEGLVG